MSSPAFLRKFIPVLLQGKVFKPINVTRTVCPFEQGLQVNSFFNLQLFVIYPYHLFNFVGHAIKPKQTIKPKKNTQL